MGFQMIASIGLGAWLGSLLDSYANFEQPIATLCGMLLGIGASLFSLIKSFKNE
ncbi:MAG: AtpZ/AtpI family protein [Bacteroidetes bacterium]|nr:MAG: AtpZ/AtpI family protein [Bacteroidota bacterium]